jgi:hypothetical protein
MSFWKLALRQSEGSRPPDVDSGIYIMLIYSPVNGATALLLITDYVVAVRSRSADEAS